MSNNVRDVSIGIKWEVGSEKLREADELTDRLIHKGSRVEGAVKFTGASVAPGNAKLKETAQHASVAEQKLKQLAPAGEKAGAGISTAMSRAERNVSKTTSIFDKLRSKLRGIESDGKSAGAGVEAGMTRIERSASKQVSVLVKVKTALSQIKNEGKTAGNSVASGAEKSAAALDKSTAAAKRNADAMKQVHSAGSGGSGGIMGVAGGGNEPGKVRSAMRDGVAMFAPGMLVAGGVMKAASGVGDMFRGGWDLTKDRQSGQAMWATSIQDEHADIQGKALDKAAEAANRQTLMTALKAGNDYTEANSIAKQIYSSDAKKYAGSTDKTNAMLTGMFNIQDANALSQREMEQFKNAVGNVGDLGKMTGGIAKSLNLVDGKITRKIRDEFKKKNGRELGKNKKGGWDWSEVDADTAFEAIDKYGNSGGVGKASERFNRTLPGMLRSAGEGSKFIISEAMSKFGSVTAKGGGFSDVIEKISNFFTDQEKMEGVANKAGEALAGVANALGEIIKAVTPFSSGVISGFSSAMSDIKSAIDTAGKWMNGIRDKIIGMLPAGTDGKFKNLSKDLGSIVGKIGGFTLALKGVSKLPFIGKHIGGIISKFGELTKLDRIPGLGKFFGMFKGKDSALNVNTGALNRLTMALGGGGLGGMMGGRGGKGGKNIPVATTRSARHAKNHRGGNWNPMNWFGGGGKAPKAPRTGHMGGKFNPLNWFGNKGASSATTAMTRSARHAPGRFGKIMGGLGSAGSFVGGSVKGLGQGVWGGAKMLGRGLKSAPGVGALFTGFDLMNVMGTTQAGTQERNQGVGSAVGAGIGGVAGGALGSFLGPAGTVGGAMAGSWLGDKAGGFVGSGWKNISKATGDAWKGTKNMASSAWNGTKDFVGGLFGGTKASASERQPSASKAVADNQKLGKSASANVGIFEKASKAMGISLGNVGKSAQKAGKDSSTVGKHAKKNEGMFEKMGKSISKSWGSVVKGSKKASDASSKNAKKMTKDSAKSFKGMDKGIKAELKKAEQAAKVGTKAIARALKNGLKGVGKDTRNVFKGISKSIRSEMNRAKKSASTGSKGITNALKSGLKGASKFTKSEFNHVSNAVKAGMSKASNAAKSGSARVVSSLQSGLKKAGNTAKTAFNGVSDAVKSGMDKAANASKSGMSKVETSIRTGMDKSTNTMKTSMDKMVAAAKSATSRVADSFSKIGSSANSAGATVTALASKINALKSKTVTITVNTQGKGADKLETGTAGAKSAFANIPAFATGGTHKGGPALVNDAKGANFREAFMLPGGTVGLFPKKRNLMVNLPAGSHVLDAESTKLKFPRYAGGTSKAGLAFKDMMQPSAPAPRQGATNNKVEININPTISISGGGMGERDLEKKVQAIVLPYLEQMGISLQAILA